MVAGSRDICHNAPLCQTILPVSVLRNCNKEGVTLPLDEEQLGVCWGDRAFWSRLDGGKRDDHSHLPSQSYGACGCLFPQRGLELAMSVPNELPQARAMTFFERLWPSLSSSFPSSTSDSSLSPSIPHRHYRSSLISCLLCPLFPPLRLEVR